jgi:hypothetical protein
MVLEQSFVSIYDGSWIDQENGEIYDFKFFNWKVLDVESFLKG